MRLEKFNYIYFLGIGGIGMSALAQWFHKSGYQVFGYDRVASAITEKLQKQGIKIDFDDSEALIPDQMKNNVFESLVIYTPAVPEKHQGFYFFRNHDFKILKRSQALGLIAKNKLGIGIAGTHGKTSISTTTAWLLNDACSAFLGGIAKNLQSNVIINPDVENVVIEADEFDRSFLTLFPTLAVISAIDADHLDIYKDEKDIQKSFIKYIRQIKPGGILLYKNNLNIDRETNPDITYYTYALDDDADFYAENLAIENGYYVFDLKTPTGIIPGFKLGVPGLYNVENAIAALAMALFAGAHPNKLLKKLETYQGVKRRFDYQIRQKNLVYIDDYAHHPTEIKTCYKSLRYLYPDKKITAIFQPHLFTRTRDFADAFAKSLDLFDQVILTDIYPAREEPIPGINSQLILNKMQNNNKQLVPYNALVDYIDQASSDVYVTLGAGNIDLLVNPIKEKLLDKIKA